MIQFSKLRLNGFKSFVDRTELDIGEGMNGVVGPNGCGKSNLVEALRWVMGENSAKRMRGGGMEDVIFSGSGKRSARNIAEVSLLLDNTTRTAPAAYNGSDEIEVVRRIERDHGSLYKINGRTVRARDVQMLFADTVTGSNSPALVSQGRVAQIINAKPLDRRMVLEESAGISGLYARRHEAELRLKAADRNLLRVEDILTGMESRLKDLKRQARQAGRYRNIAAQIRQIELLIGWLEWEKLHERSQELIKRFEAAESIVAQKMAMVTQLTKTQTVQAKDVQPLREAEAKIAASLQTQRLALQRLEDAAERREELVREAKSQLEQTTHDHEHETRSLSESKAALERLEGELKVLIEKEKAEDGSFEEKQKMRDELESQTIKLESRYTLLMQGEAEAKARKQSLEHQLKQNKDRLEVVLTRHEKAQEDLSTLEQNNQGADEIGVLEKQIESTESELNDVHSLIENLKQQKDTADQQMQDSRDMLKDAERKGSEIRTEISMLESFLDGQKDGSFTPLLDSVAADEGFEKALSRALGDSLMASMDDEAPMRWVSRKSPDDMPALPAGCSALLPHVKAPDVLHLALSQIGVVEDDADGHVLAAALLPGQSLVSVAGTYWRWDGLQIKAEASDRNAQHLEQKNKLQALQERLPDIQAAIEAAQKALELARQKQQEIIAKQDEAQTQRREKDRALTDARAQLSRLREQFARYDAQKTHLQQTVKTAEEDIKTLEGVIKWDQQRLDSALEEISKESGENPGEVKASLDEAREAYQDAVRAYDIYQQETNTRKARLHAISDEKINLQNRSIRSAERLKELEERKEGLIRKLKDVSIAPESFQKDKDALLDKISEVEKARSDAAEKLATLEVDLNETTNALKDAERQLSDAKEDRAGAQATLSGIREQQEVMKAGIREQFEMEPQELRSHIALDLEKNTQGLDELRREKDELVRQRENIGPVNLRAEQEADELEKEVTTLLHERNDLMAAIEELRGGINKINKEARERLVTAFEHVNAHFQRLFTRLFNGGNAYLSLVDSDDPLGAGLEIFAQPPGKALQALSLLSGGEQALTSIALIFGMFLTNPSPICVLDEIDAPLDDANVDRLCMMLEEISARGETRFLVVTHHRMTMARMDRLYGVTMAERGVSQLVSVDLQQSFDFLEEAA